MSEEIIRYEEVSPTAKLWRYMDLAKFISLIGKKKLYFPSLESFEDIFEGAKGIGQKLQEHMNQSFNTLSSIVRKVYAGHEPLTIHGTGVSPKDGRASAIFDLVGKAPSEFFFDTAKQKFNTGKWMKTFKPILAATFIGTVAAQFLFGKKDADIKA